MNTETTTPPISDSVQDYIDHLGNEVFSILDCSISDADSHEEKVFLQQKLDRLEAGMYELYTASSEQERLSATSKLQALEAEIEYLYEEAA